MAKKEQLRTIRRDTVINLTSKAQEGDVATALKRVEKKLVDKYGLKLDFVKIWRLKDIVASLREKFPDIDFHHHFNNTSIRPDGGILSLVSDGRRFPILISEVKHQGTNALRAMEGLTKQARGNAIERLGKNVIGLRTATISESIFPFVCFGYGCDFADDSSILDRVTTIAMFGELNKTHLHQQGPNGEFRRGSFYFREMKWTVAEMVEIMFDIADRSIQYYFSKYRQDTFLRLS